MFVPLVNKSNKQDYYCYYFFAFAVALVELLGTRFALNDGIDGFQVGRVGDDSQTDVLIRDTVKPFNVRAQVVFDVSGSLVLIKIRKNNTT